ncbi:MAG: FAD:protein FMN transferase [Eubacterium sp.]|nr:FAD:protein FMN transferase [Eubacterium sp.]
MHYQTTEKIFPALGTLNSIVLRGQAEEIEASSALLKKIQDKVTRLDDMLSLYKPDSEISQLNHAAGMHACAVSADTFRIFQDAVAYSELTDRAFDITAVSLSLLWKENLSRQKIPGRLEVCSALRHTNYQNVLLIGDIDAGSFRIFLKKKGMIADLGGIAKGYAAGLAVEMIRNAGIPDALINFGGTIFAIGAEKEIGIQNPFFHRTAGEQIIGKLRIRNQAVVTSSAGEQHWVIDGKTYHHIIDPGTGYPSASDLCSVTLVGTNATELDALATGCMVLGIQKSLPILQGRGVEAVFIRTDGAVLYTPGLRTVFRTEPPAMRQHISRYSPRQ